MVKITVMFQQWHRLYIEQWSNSLFISVTHVGTIISVPLNIYFQEANWINVFIKLIEQLIALPEQGFNGFPLLFNITCMNIKIHSFNVTIQFFFVSIPIPWIYSSLLRTTETVQHTSAQSIRLSELSRGLGDRMRVKLITDRDLELVPHVCSYCMIK